MNRRDIIILSVLINACLLALLFMTAVHTTEEDEIIAMPSLPEEKKTLVLHDEPKKEEFSDDSFSLDLLVEELALKEDEVEKPVFQAKETEAKNYVEVTVRRGDYLDKIARANRTTVDEIKALNNLKSERISVGQVLKIPLGAQKASKEQKAATAMPLEEEAGEYYVLKTGDSPWKVSKQYHVSVDELLKLNELDEAKAKNLRPGDRIRIR